MFKIALGAGHYLGMPGKRTLKSLDPNETREWVLNDRVCDKVEQKLRAYEGYELLRLDDTTGEKDTTLSERVNAANRWGADFYLSIHHNAGIKGGSGGGIVAYSYYGSRRGAEWRDLLYDKLIEYTGLRGNRSDPLREAGYYVIKYSDAPAVLLELGFMDSKTDVPVILTDEYADKCAAAIVKAIAEREHLKKKEEADDVIRYKTLEEIPEWGRPTIEKLIELGYLMGGSDGLGLTEDMVRMFVVNDRAGLYGQSEDK